VIDGDGVAVPLNHPTPEKGETDPATSADSLGDAEVQHGQGNRVKEERPGALPLDPAKGREALWNPLLLGSCLE
jgi:hypothetical protein